MIEWLTQPGDMVYDPFSGRGTTPLEALLLGRQAAASDANPLAVALSRAKTVLPSYYEASTRLKNLAKQFNAGDVDIHNEPEDITMLYSDWTLRQLVYLKNGLRKNHPTDNLLRAVVLGMLHANHSQAGATAGFSISMPNTFAMSPGYVRKFIAEHGLKKPDVDVFAMVQAKLDRLDLPEEKLKAGSAWTQDATRTSPGDLKKAAPKLVLTSPPYLQVIKYGKYNWIRLWFLGDEPKEVDAKLMASGSLPRYLDFMGQVLEQLRSTVAEDGFVCLVIGDVRRKDQDLNLAQAVWDEVASAQGWHLHGIVADSLPTQHKVSRIWKNNAGRATKIDRVLIISPQAVELPEPISLTWEKPTLPKKEFVTT